MAAYDIPNWLDEAVTKLSDTSKHCCTLETDQNLPRVFQETSRLIDVAQEVLKCAKDQLDANTLNIENDDLYEKLDITKSKADTLRSIFQSVVAGPESTRIERYEKVLKQRRETKLEGVLMELLKALKTLVDAKLILATEEQNKKLTDAIQDLAKLAPDVAHEGGNLFTHGGVGDMYNSTGPGKQYNNKGGGDMNNADTIYLERKKK